VVSVLWLLTGHCEGWTGLPADGGLRMKTA